MHLINISDYAVTMPFMEAVPTQEMHTFSSFTTVSPSLPISIS